MSRHKISFFAFLIILVTLLSYGCNAGDDVHSSTLPSTAVPTETTEATLVPTIEETIPDDFQLFALDGISLALPEDFEEVPDQQWPTFYSGYSIVIVVREQITTHPSISDMSLDEYCSALIASRNMDATVRVQDGLHWFDYDTYTPDSEVKYNRFVVVYKTDTDFWIVEFTCDSRVTVRLRPYFFKWAKMIEFTQ